MADDDDGVYTPPNPPTLFDRLTDDQQREIRTYADKLFAHYSCQLAIVKQPTVVTVDTSPSCFETVSREDFVVKVMRSNGGELEYLERPTILNATDRHAVQTKEWISQLQPTDSPVLYCLLPLHFFGILVYNVLKVLLQLFYNYNTTTTKIEPPKRPLF